MANRPAPLESPTDCRHFSTGEDFLRGWAAWYEAIDESVLPEHELKKKASKKGLTVPEAFAGLLIFDLMCLAAVKLDKFKFRFGAVYDHPL